MRDALYDRPVFAADNALSTTFFRSTIQPAYGGLAHEERWFELSHIVGILLSIYYYGFITDAAHAALVASMMGVFYFDRTQKKNIRLAANSTLKGRGLVSPRPLVTALSAAFCSIHQGLLGL